MGLPNLPGEAKTESDTAITPALTSSEIDDGSWKELSPHKDEEQVQLDVNRAFIYYPSRKNPSAPTMSQNSALVPVALLREPPAWYHESLHAANSPLADQSTSELDRQKRELSDVIVQVLRRYPFLCYFQGYHDICQVFLLVLPAPLRAPLVARLSALRIRDFMLPNLAPAVAQLRLIPDILRAADPTLWRHLSHTEPFFALSGTLTMYAHDVQSLGEIARLFDVLLAREPVFSVYMFAQIVLNRRAELFDTPESEPEMLHSILSKLPQPLDLDGLIRDTTVLFQRHPPEKLRAWRGISRNSVLKTARSTEDCARQSIEDGREFFRKQVIELRLAEARDKVMAVAWRYRRPARAVGLAVIVGVVAYLLRRSPASWTSLTSWLSRLIGH